MNAQPMSQTTTAYVAPAETRVGHVHFRVANLERAIAFYQDMLGFHINQDMRTEPIPRQVAFLSTNEYHHYVALAEFPEVTPPTTQQAGLFHVALVYPNRRELARVLKRLVDAGYPVDSCHEYGTGEAINLRDPDGIPLELYYDRPYDELPRVDGKIRAFNQRIEPATILSELQKEEW